MVPLPCTGSNVRSVDMQFTQVAYGGCWKCLQDWQRCNASTPCLAASQKGLVHSFGTGIGLVTLLQSLIVTSLPLSLGASRSRRGISNALLLSGQSLLNASRHSVSRALEQHLYHKITRGSIMHPMRKRFHILGTPR